MNYRSLNFIYFMRSSLVSHWSIIPSMIFIRQTVFKILSKILGLRNIAHWCIYIFRGQSLCHIDRLSHDIPPLNNLEDIKQNHWTEKYRSLTYIYVKRSIFASHWCIITSMTLLHRIVFKILSKVTGPWNIDLPIFCEVNLCVTLIRIPSKIK